MNSDVVLLLSHKRFKNEREAKMCVDDCQRKTQEETAIKINAFCSNVFACKRMSNSFEDRRRHQFSLLSFFILKKERIRHSFACKDRTPDGNAIKLNVFQFCVRSENASVRFFHLPLFRFSVIFRKDSAYVCAITRDRKGQ